MLVKLCPRGTAQNMRALPRALSTERMRMSYLPLIIAILAIAAVISLVLSFLGILVVGALRLLPIVFIVLLVLVLLGKIRINITRSDGSRSRWLDD